MNRALSERPKGHHFIPVPHLARFSLDAASMPPRSRRLWVFDKRSAQTRRSKTARVALENDLYTVRLPLLAAEGPPGDISELIERVLDPGNKDAGLESDKIEIEERGIAAISQMETWEPGIREVSEDERAPVLAYIGLLLAQHPSMMRARTERVSERFWARVGSTVERHPILERLTRSFDEGSAAFGVVFDGLATALELNYLAWKIIEWRDGPRLILGDTAVVASGGEPRLGRVDPWARGVRFVLPLSPQRALVLSDHAPGVCVIEDRSGPKSASEVLMFNIMSWARARAEVYAGSEAELIETMSALGRLDPTSDNSMQLAVRDEVLPDFAMSSDGLTITPPRNPDAGEVARRYAQRFGLPEPD